MSTPSFLQLARKAYHLALLDKGVLCIFERTKPEAGLPSTIPSNADGDSASSIAIAQLIFDQLNSSKAKAGVKLVGQMSGRRFEQITRSYVENTFAAFRHLRPGLWEYLPAKEEIQSYEQYSHLAELAELTKKYEELAVHLGHRSDYLIAPDILVIRTPESDEAISIGEVLVDERVATRSPRRGRFNRIPLIHASISCKWSLRNGGAQTVRSEALNLIRKGRVPHVVVVTGEPLPSRLASLALGTGDIDCVYHFALPELIAGVKELGNDEATSMVNIMTEGKRLKDISDLPLDLVV